MIEFDQWIAGKPFGTDRQFLVMGKGPTYAHKDEFELGDYVTISLNHVVTDGPVDIAHMIDFDVAEACAESIAANAQWLLMPRHPHLAFKPTILPLHELIKHVPALARLESEGRIVCYDLSTAPTAKSRIVISATYFSSEAAVDIAGHLEAGRVATLGVDGGTQYAGAFAGLSGTTRLANGQPSFSLQFEEIGRISRKHGIRVDPLVPPLKIFVGVQERELIAARVLAFTINEHATRPVQVEHLHPVVREPVDPKNRQRTPFSFSRFLIPELMGYEGRALYVDSDMHVFDDITKLWDIPFDGAKVLCTNQTFIPPQWRDNPDFHPGRQMSVMMLDCENLPWKIDEIIDRMDAGELTYEDLLFEMKLVSDDEVRDGLPEGWNHLEHFIPGETKLLHYTAIPTQPWKSEQNPNGKIWEEAFVRACEAGYVDVELVEEHVRAGHVRSSLRDLVPPPPRSGPAAHASATAAELEATRAALARHQRLNPKAAWRAGVGRVSRAKSTATARATLRRARQAAGRRLSRSR